MTALVQIVLVLGAVICAVVIARDAHARGRARVRRAFPEVDPAPAVKAYREARDYYTSR